MNAVNTANKANDRRFILKWAFSNSIYLEESNNISDKDNNFLDEVVNQIVRETEVDYVSKKIKLRFTSSYTYLDIVDAYIFPYPPFEEHLEGVYGLKNMS